MKLRTAVITYIAIAGILAYGNSRAWNSHSESDFDAGYEEGYRAIKGDMVILPITPIEPITPIGSTPYREGLKEGMRDAQESERRGYRYAR